MEGPHCPKCGEHNRWEYYAGAVPSPDALRCVAVIGGLECGYIHWYRNNNAPAVSNAGDPPAVDWREAQLQSMAREAVREKRARVRALVHSMMASGLSYDKFDTEWLVIYECVRKAALAGEAPEIEAELDRVRAKSIVVVAAQIDEEIEKIGMVSGET